jgi:hypothetical protein
VRRLTRSNILLSLENVSSGKAISSCKIKYIGECSGKYSEKSTATNLGMYYEEALP